MQIDYCHKHVRILTLTPQNSATKKIVIKHELVIAFFRSTVILWENNNFTRRLVPDIGR